MQLLKLLKKRGGPNTLSEYMQSNGIRTQKELARYLDVSESLISRFFSGKRSFSKGDALRIHKKTGIPLENLIQ